MELHGTFPWNSMENVDAGISMEIVVLMFSMEFHGKCPNPPWKSMEKFPWNSMEIDVLILHGIPWRFFTRVFGKSSFLDREPLTMIQTLYNFSPLLIFEFGSICRCLAFPGKIYR